MSHLQLVPLPTVVEEDFELNLDELAALHPEAAMIAADTALKRQVNSSRQAWAMMAQIVHYVKKTGIWQFHPDNFSSFNAWCQQPEIELPPSVLSDMLAIVTHAPKILEHTGIDLFETIGRAGQSKVRQIVPLIRHSVAASQFEDIGDVLAELEGSSFRDILKMLSPSGQRIAFDPEVVYQENDDGTANLILRNLDLDRLELASNKLGIKRWFNENGYRIPNPLDLLLGDGEGMGNPGANPNPLDYLLSGGDSVDEDDLDQSEQIAS